MDTSNELNFLASRAGFNTALRHFKAVSGFASDVQDGRNLSDLLNESLEEEHIQSFQVRSILNALLIEKFAYASKSHNLDRTVEDVSRLVSVLEKWNNLQFVLAYYHPQNGLAILNPSREDSWETVLPLVQDELIVVYAGFAAEEHDAQVLQSAAEDFLKLLYGGKAVSRKGYTTTKVVQKKSAQKKEEKAPGPVAAASSPGRRVTPKYSVIVTNELFHNGNVEAWKKIIESYQTKYPDLDVLIWYENERINDINALFKWGKVKHGVPILFSVAGENLRDISKLQRYLFEGASPRFEVFLKGEFGRVLDLF